jgi:uncharacterized phage protein (TIGR02220 family)
MADQHKWFKLWFTALSDPDLQLLPPAHRWAWAALGAYTKVHGSRGRVAVNPANASLLSAMGVPADDLRAVVSTFPNVCISEFTEEVTSRNGGFIVTWANWSKYQEDTTRAERAQTWRNKRRGDKRRGDVVVPNGTTTPLSPPPGGHVPAHSNGHDPTLEQARGVLDFLNRKAGRNYRPTTTNLDPIRARLRSGATVEQIRAVIAVKAREWNGRADMATYLRPETLFRASKFESYLGQLPATAFERTEVEAL